MEDWNNNQTSSASRLRTGLLAVFVIVVAIAVGRWQQNRPTQVVLRGLSADATVAVDGIVLVDPTAPFTMEPGLHSVVIDERGKLPAQYEVTVEARESVALENDQPAGDLVGTTSTVTAPLAELMMTPTGTPALVSVDDTVVRIFSIPTVRSTAARPLGLSSAPKTTSGQWSVAALFPTARASVPEASPTATLPTYSRTASDYTASLVSGPVNATLAHGESATLEVQLRNTGSATWYQGVVRLASDRPADRVPIFDPGTGWERCNRAQLQEPAVPPGSIGTFRFTITATTLTAPGTYREHFRPVVDGVTWMEDVGIMVDVTVTASPTATTTTPTHDRDPSHYAASLVNQSASPSVTRGHSTTLEVTLRNTGSATWRKGVVRLASDRPADRVSIFDPTGTGWERCNRIELEPDSVPPGSTGTFRFAMTATTLTPLGTYREHFRPVVDGVTWMEDVGISWDITIEDEGLGGVPPLADVPELAPTLTLDLGSLAGGLVVSFAADADAGRAFIQTVQASGERFGIVTAEGVTVLADVTSAAANANATKVFSIVKSNESAVLQSHNESGAVTGTLVENLHAESKALNADSTGDQLAWISPSDDYKQTVVHYFSNGREVTATVDAVLSSDFTFSPAGAVGFLEIPNGADAATLSLLHADGTLQRTTLEPIDQLWQVTADGTGIWQIVPGELRAKLGVRQYQLVRQPLAGGDPSVSITFHEPLSWPILGLAVDETDKRATLIAGSQAQVLELP